MFSALTPVADDARRTGGHARLFAAAGRRHAGRDVLDVHVIDRIDEPAQERHRVLAGNEDVACVQVHPQVGRIAELEHTADEVRPGGEIAVRLDIHNDLVSATSMICWSSASSGPWPAHPSGPAGRAGRRSYRREDCQPGPPRRWPSSRKARRTAGRPCPTADRPRRSAKTGRHSVPSFAAARRDLRRGPRGENSPALGSSSPHRSCRTRYDAPWFR